MTFRASSQTLDDALKAAKRDAWALRVAVLDYAAAFATGGTATDVLNCHRRLVVAISSLTAVAATPGLAQYAQAQEGDATYDVAAEFTAMLGAAVAARDWIEANFPAAGGYLQANSFVGHAVTPRPFTAGQLAGLVTVLNAVATTIA
jgi:hypothetical protein